MKNGFLLLVITMTIFSAKTIFSDTNRKKLLNLIKQEEKSVVRILSKKKDPSLYRRLMVLNMERFSIIHKIENERFLSMPLEDVDKKKKEDYFRHSNRIYNKIQKVGRIVLTKYPKFQHNDEISYILAVMTIERGNQDEIKKKVASYLKHGITKSKQGSPTYKKLVIKLAEHYYDQKNHSEAVKYYHQVLSFNKDKWYTRYLYNMGLSLMALEKTDKAKEYIKKSLTLSIRNKKYISYSEKIFDKLPIFIDKTDIEGFFLPFKPYLKLRSKDFFIKMAALAKEVGKYSFTIYILEYAIKIFREKGNANNVFRFQMEKMDFYLEVKKDKTLITYTRNFVEKYKHSFQKKQKKEISERIKRHIRSLQDQGNPKNLDAVVFNFNTLKILDPKNSISYFFYEGEAYFFYKKYNQAFSTYKTALEKIKKTKGVAKDPLTKKIFDSMIKSLEQGLYSAKKKESYNIYVYKNHLRIYPKSERSRKMYQRLFNIYFKNKNYKNCEKVLSIYLKNYPHRDKNNNPINKDDIKNQQFMLSQIIDNYINIENTKKAEFWVNRMKGKVFAFDRKYIIKASTILVTSIYNNIWKIPNLDNQNQQYKKVYNNEYVRSDIRADSAYFIGKNNLKFLRTKQSSVWVQKSLVLLNVEKRLKRQKDVLSFILKMVHLQDFSSAGKLATVYFSKHCKHDYSLKKDFYNATVLYALLDKKHDLALKNFELGKNCKISSTIQEANLRTMITFFMNNRNYDFFENLFQRYSLSNVLQKDFTQALLKLYWESFISGNQKGQSFVLFHLKNNSIPISGEVKAVINFHKLREKMGKEDDYHFAFQDSNIKVLKEVPQTSKKQNRTQAQVKTKTTPPVFEEKFNEDFFNKKLEKYIGDINTFKNEIEQHINTGYPHIIIYGLKNLYKRYYLFSQELLNFTPKGVDKNYKKAFLQEMSGLGKQLLGEAKNRKNEIVKFLRKNELLYSDKKNPLVIQPVHLSVSSADGRVRGQ